MNIVLYDIPLGEIMIDILSLDRVMRREWELGFEGLSDLVQVSIPSNISAVIEGTVADKK